MAKKKKKVNIPEKILKDAERQEFIKTIPQKVTREDITMEDRKKMEELKPAGEKLPPKSFKDLSSQEFFNLPSIEKEVKQGEKERVERKITQPEMIINEETGKISGVRLPDGRQFLGISPQEAQQMAASYAQQQAIPAGAVGAAEAGQEFRQQERAAQLSQQIGAPGQVGVMGAGQPSSIDWRQVGLSAISDPSTIRDLGMGIGGGIIAGSVTAGASAGAIGGPAGVALGAAGGLALGLYSSIMRNINSQKSGILSAQKSTLTDGRQNLRRLTQAANLDPGNADLYIQAFNMQLDKIGQAYSQLKIDTQTDLNLALSKDGTREIQRFKNFYAPGGAKDYYSDKMRVAIEAPDPQMAISGLMMSQENLGAQNE